MTSYLLGNMVFSARLAFLPALSLSKCRKIFLICGLSSRNFTRAAGVVLSSIFSWADTHRREKQGCPCATLCPPSFQALHRTAGQWHTQEMHRAAVAVFDPKRIVLVTTGAVTQNTAVIGCSVRRIAREILLIKAHAHKVVIRQALENQSLVNAVLDDGIVDAPAKKILCNLICGNTFIRQK